MNIEIPYFIHSRWKLLFPLAKLVITKDCIDFLPQGDLSIPRKNARVNCPKFELDHAYRIDGLRKGVGFKMKSGKTHYFWTLQRSKVLEALLEFGYVLGTDKNPRFYELDPNLHFRRFWKDSRSTD